MPSELELNLLPFTSYCRHSPQRNLLPLGRDSAPRVMETFQVYVFINLMSRLLRGTESAT
jgi:hypothetical protein